MRRVIFLVGLGTGIYLGAHPLLMRLATLAQTMLDIEQTHRRQAREERMHQVPVGWGEGVEAAPPASWWHTDPTP